MSASKLDAVYRSILLTKFFTKGWGKPENLRRLFEFRKVVSNRDECFKLIDRDYPVTITKEESLSDCRFVEGYFTTPLEKFLPGIVPKIAQIAHFQALLPVHWPEPGCKPVCLHLAGTGDHFFWRRRNLMVKPLLKEAGIGGIILENPFYGLRKPTDQVRSSLHNVSDIFVMGGCLILESLVLFHWCERNGLGPLGVTGLSMGGHMASLAATNWPKPLVLVPCLSWSTASAVFLQGVMSQSINWDLLEDQYLSDGAYREKLSKMVTIVDEAFLAGKKFAQTYSQKVEKEKQTDAQSDKHANVVNNDKDDKNLDITYKESNGENKIEAEGIIDLTKKVQDLNDVPKNILSNKAFVQIQRLSEELKKLLEENKITKTLYDKLTSNEKFQLDPDDIDNINKLNKEDVKELILRYKIESLRSETESNLENEVQISNPEPNLKAETNEVETENPPDVTITEKPQIDCTITEKPQIDCTITEKPQIDCTITEKPQIDCTIIEKPQPDGTITAKPQLDSTVTKKLHPDGTVTMKKSDKKSWNMSDLTSDLWVNLPFMRSSGKKIDISKIHWRDREALQFMRGIMDECTHLSNFSVPFDTSLIIAVCAKHDAYVPREDVGTLEEIWPGAEVRYVDAGHVSAYILHQSLFRACIREAFERSKKKWKDGKHVN